MAHRKKTLRRMPPTTRRIAKTISEAENAIRRLKKLLPELQTMESLANAENKRNQHNGNVVPGEIAERFNNGGNELWNT